VKNDEVVGCNDSKSWRERSLRRLSQSQPVSSMSSITNISVGPATNPMEYLGNPFESSCQSPRATIPNIGCDDLASAEMSLHPTTSSVVTSVKKFDLSKARKIPARPVPIPAHDCNHQSHSTNMGNCAEVGESDDIDLS